VFPVLCFEAEVRYRTLHIEVMICNYVEFFLVRGSAVTTSELMKHVGCYLD